jgi:hypothetical protein
MFGPYACRVWIWDMVGIWEASKEAFLWRFLAATMSEAVNESRDAKLCGNFLGVKPAFELDWI